MFQYLLWMYGMAWMSVRLTPPEMLSQSMPDIEDYEVIAETLVYSSNKSIV